MAPKAVAKKSIDEQQEVTFYSWVENQPSSLWFHVKGGEKVVTADKQIAKMPMKEARFRLGVYATSDPETIEELDKAIAQGANITRDYDLFLKNTMKPEDFALHVQGKNSSLTDEIEDLKRQLAEHEAK